MPMNDFSFLGPFKLAMFYAGYLYFFATPVALWIIAKKTGWLRAIAAMFFAGISLLAYARFVEPRILLTPEHEIELAGCFATPGAARIAVYSDTHIGMFGNAMPVSRIVNRINKEKPDFTLFAGDFIYYLDEENLADAFSPLRDLQQPLFAVLGNHDVGLPGPDYTDPLTTKLRSSEVIFVDNNALRLSNSNFALELVGLSELWARRQELSLLEGQTDHPRLVLSHNPATIGNVDDGDDVDLLIGGHTHGGQVQLPFLTCFLTGVCGDVAYGLREVKNRLVFTTSGTGMVGLAMRFRVPPRVDILNLTWNVCD